MATIKNTQGLLTKVWTFFLALLAISSAQLVTQGALAAEPIRVGVTASLTGSLCGPGQ